MKIFRIAKKYAKKVSSMASFVFYLFRWTISYRKEKHHDIAFLFNFSRWKYNYVDSFLPEYTVKYIPEDINMNLLRLLITRYPNKVMINWGYKNEEYVNKLAEKIQVPLLRMEDGFIRSHGLGSMLTTPLSMCLDNQELYFNATKPSDLEDILNHYSFNENPQLINRSKQVIQSLLKLKISKYNHVSTQNIEEIYGIKEKKRILVIGQVEDDASIKYGCNSDYNNNDLVRLAKEENPDADILYKPHPDVMQGRRDIYSNPNEIKHIAKIIETPLSISDAFETIDHVYTITSLAGFEALLRGIEVTTIGAPFYSGWGLTNDRQATPRRTRRLTVEELFAGAYILYPRYVDPESKSIIAIEEAIRYLSKK